MTLSTQQAQQLREARTMLKSIASDINSQWDNWLAKAPTDPKDWTEKQCAINQAYVNLLWIDSPDEFRDCPYNV